MLFAISCALEIMISSVSGASSSGMDDWQLVRVLRSKTMDGLPSLNKLAVTRTLPIYSQPAKVFRVSPTCGSIKRTTTTWLPSCTSKRSCGGMPSDAFPTSGTITAPSKHPSRYGDDSMGFRDGPNWNSIVSAFSRKQRLPGPVRGSPRPRPWEVRFVDRWFDVICLGSFVKLNSKSGKYRLSARSGAETAPLTIATQSK